MYHVMRITVDGQECVVVDVESAKPSLSKEYVLAVLQDTDVAENLYSKVSYEDEVGASEDRSASLSSDSSTSDEGPLIRAEVIDGGHIGTVTLRKE